MTEHEYRTLNAYANSDLGELFNLKTLQPINPISPKSAQYGTTFHTLVLESQKPIDWTLHHVTEHAKLLKMRDAFVSYWMRYYPEFPVAAQEVEKVVLRTCPETGLPLKAKLDLIARHPDKPTTIFDVKSTSARSPQDFFDTFVKYGYDRQAAYYLDMLGLAYNFVFVGVKKTAPFDIYVVDMNSTADRRTIIDRGRAKNARLLRDALAESQKPGGWKPSSWSRIETPITTLS